MENQDKNIINRRNFMKNIGVAAVSSAALYACGPFKKDVTDEIELSDNDVPTDKMTYRVNSRTGDKVSLLGFGFMRLPMLLKDKNETNGKITEEIDQDTVNLLVDYAIEHGVNYFDTSPVYVGGKSEQSMGIALSRHPRDKYFVATKLSNFSKAPDVRSLEGAIEMYHNSMKELKVDYLDYYLLHAVGFGGMSEFRARHIDNGVLDYFLKERKAGRIRNLGWSFHGEKEVFDYLVDSDIKWDFVQIQLNYVDWRNAQESNVNAEYLYERLTKRNIPVIVMEPILGGRLAKLNKYSTAILKQIKPQDSIGAWAFRFAADFPNVLTVLSGMKYKEHLKDNILTYSPLTPLTTQDRNNLEEIAQIFLKYPTVSCTECKYCMPCPYGIDIPSIFAHYNRCVYEERIPKDKLDENYYNARREFLIGYDRSVPELRQANHCIGCNKCTPSCPQHINIPAEMQRIDKFVESLKRGEDVKLTLGKDV